MRKFASVDKEGEVMGLVVPSVEGEIEGGVTTDPVNPSWTYYEVTPDLNQFFSSSTYWHDTKQWRVRGAQPSPHHSWASGAWVLDTDALWKDIRKHRNTKLTETDWTQLPDSSLTQEQKNAWVSYRQELRNVPVNNEEVQSLEEINWPVIPSL